MASVIAGESLGVLNSSLLVLGQRGQLGGASHGAAGERVYVNAATGNLVLQRQDDLLVGAGIDLSALRTYNSQGLLDDDNGDNWRLGLYRRVYGVAGGSGVNTADSTVRRVDADGSEAVYTYDVASAKYLSLAGEGAQDSLAYNTTTQEWTWTDGSTGAVERYDAQQGGRITHATDRNNRTLTYAYHATSGLITSVSNGEESIQLTYSGTNLTEVRTQKENDAYVTRARYAYDGSDRLITVEIDLTPEDNATTDGAKFLVNYTYDGTSRRIATMTQSDGTSLAFQYVQVGADWRVSSVTDALGRVTSLAYNTTARTTTVTDPLGLVTTLSYDTAGRLTGISGPTVNGAPQVLGFTYDGSGNVTQTTDARGNVVTYQYDSRGNWTLRRDAAGNTVTRTYGTGNQLLEETVYLVADPDGANPTGQPSQPRTTRYAYDAQLNLRFAVDADGRVTEHKYTSGQHTATLRYAADVYTTSGTLAESAMDAWVTALGNNRARAERTDYTYDIRGLLATSTTYGALDNTGAGVTGSKAETHYVYDQAGQLLATVDPRGVATTATAGDYTTTLAYDGLGRVLSATDSLGRTTLTQYDAANREVRVTLANGLVRVSAYNTAGELIGVVERVGTNPALGETKYFYDAAGRLRRVEDPTGLRTHVLYDAAGRRIATIDGDGSLTEYRYDANNNLSRTVRYATRVTSTALATLTNGAGVPQNVTIASLVSANAADRSTWNAYDAADRLVKSVDEAGFVTEHFYDAAGRSTGTRRYAAALSTGSLGDTPAASAIAPSTTSGTAGDRTTRVLYDAQGRKTGEVDAEGYFTEYKYDAAGRLVETVRYVTLGDTGDTAEDVRPTSHANDQHTRFLYNARGQLAGTVDAEGFLTETVYDAAGNATQTLRYSVAVTYTSTSTVDSLRPTTPAVFTVQSVVRTYDALNRVASETAVDGTVTQFDYDEVGNLVSTTRAVGTGEVRALNVRFDRQGRVIAELSGNGSALLTPEMTQQQIDAVWADHAIEHTYDAAGRRTSTKDALDQKTVFYYDADGRLTYTVNALGEVKRSVYNGHGQLVETIAYGTRLGSPGTLTGGVATSTFESSVAAIADPLKDSKVTYTYHTTGTLQQAVDALTNATTYTYNAFGELASSVQVLGGGSTLTTQHAYDRRGLRLSATADPSGIAALTSTQYDAFGRATQLTDANGNVRTRTYDRLGQTVATVDPGSVNRSLTYDAFGRVLTQTDALSNTTTFAYNTAARSVTMTTPEGIATTTVRTRHGETYSITDGRGATTTYAYDKNGNLVSVTDPLNQVATRDYDKANNLYETEDAAGNKVRFSYDAANRVLTRQVDPGGLNLTTTYAYDPQGRTVDVTDANGVLTRTSFDLKGQATTVAVDPTGLNLRTTFTYDAQGRKLSVTEGAGTSSARVRSFEYDKLGRLKKEIVDPGSSPHLNLQTLYDYDKNGNVLSRTDPAGNVTRYFYDGNDRVRFTVDALNRVQESRYDGEGRITATVLYAQTITLDSTPTLAEVVAWAAVTANAAGARAERHFHDEDGRLVYTVDALNAVSEKRYDGAGNVVATVRYANAIALDSTPTFSEVRDWAEDTEPNNAAGARVERHFYDAAGRLYFTVDALNFVSEKRYDGAGNVVATFRYANAIVLDTTPELSEVLDWALDTDPNNAIGARVERRVYDAAGRLVYAVDALNYIKQTKYDAAGRITETVHYSQAISAPTVWTLANVASALSSQNNSPTSQGNTFEYDAAGRLIESTDAEGFSEVFTYDDAGNKLSFTNKKNATWNYGYDGAGRLTSELSPQVAVTSSIHATTFAPTTEQARIETRIAYDALGNVTSRTEAYGRTEARTTQYQYDALGRQVRTIFPSVGVYSGDALTTNSGTSGTVTRSESTVAPEVNVTYDVAGNAVMNRDAANNYSYKVHDVLGRVVYEIDAERYVTKYGYDAFGNKATTTRYATALNFGAVSGYAARTDGTPFTLAEVQARLTESSASDRIITTTYDALDRAILVVEPEVFTFDPTATGSDRYFTAGRRTQNTFNAFGDVLRQAVLRNKPDAATQIWDGSYSYYDLRGNRTAFIDALGYITTWEYDETGDLKRQIEYAAKLAPGSWSLTTLPTLTATTAANATAEGYDREVVYQYDRKNQKISETRVGVRIGTVTGTLTLGTTIGNVTTLYGYDGVGNVTSVTDPNGAITYTYYDALGRTTGVAEPARSTTAAGGVLVMPPLYLSYNSGTNAATLTFARNHASDTTVGLRYKAAGATDWTPGTLTLSANTYGLALTGAATDQYAYELTYTRAGESTPYATGTGFFNLVGPTTTGSVNVAAVVEKPSLSYSTAASAHVQEVSNGEGGYDNVFNGNNLINLSWHSLHALGEGGVRVSVTYLSKRFTYYGPGGESGYTISEGGAGTTLTRSITYGSGAAASGIAFSWTDASPTAGNTTVYGGIQSISSVRVEKQINGTWVEVLDSTDGPQPERLLLRGDTAGLTHIQVGSNQIAATHLGGGAYSVDLSSLARGKHSYTVVGTASAGGSFELLRNGPAGNGGLQEINATSTTRRLTTHGLPASAHSVELQYRRVGDTGPYLSKSLALVTDVNEFRVAYDDVANGAYEYILTVRNSSGVLVNLTSIGGTANGTLSGTIEVSRGGELPDVSSTGTVATLTPLTVMRHDAFGKVVETTRYAKGTTGADVHGPGLPLSDPADQNQKTRAFYDSHGRIVRAVDAEGASSYTSYDVMGRAAKTWQPITDNDGIVQHAVRAYQYDKVGRQVATIEPSYAPNMGPASGSAQSLHLQTLTFSRTSATFNGLNFVGTNTISVSFNEMQSWGAGDVEVTAYYRDYTIVSSEYGYGTDPGTFRTRTTTVNASATGATFSWTDSASDSGGIHSIQRVVVRKKDALGAWVTIHDRTASGAYGHRVATATPGQAGTIVNAVRKQGAGAWTNMALVNMGSRYITTTTSEVGGAGTWSYEVRYTQPGASTPAVVAAGAYAYSSNASAGTLTAGATSIAEASFARSQVQYNAFGEVVKKGLNDGEQEFYDYDRAGRLWRTNQNGGADEVTLYDVNGRATASIKSQTVDLKDAYVYEHATVDDLQDLANRTTEVQRTNTRYDALGRVVEQALPTYFNDGLDAIASTVAFPQLTASHSRTTAIWEVVGESGAQWNGTNTITVSWPNMNWGGNVRVTAYYTTYVLQGPGGEAGYTMGTGYARSTAPMVVSSASGATGVTFSWTDSPYGSEGGVHSVQHILVEKQSATGSWHTIYNSQGGTPLMGGDALVWDVPTQVGTTYTLKYKLAAGTTWTEASLVNFGGKIMFDTRGLGLTSADYEYEILYMRPGPGGVAYAHKTGTFNVSTNAHTDTTQAGVATTPTEPKLQQTHDRWGNVIAATDARNLTTNSRYNFLNQLIQEEKPEVLVWGEDGDDDSERPTTYNYYDAAGRGIGTIDANGNAKTARYDAAGQMVKEYHADGGVLSFEYDALGRQIRAADAIGNVTTTNFDRNDRIVSVQRPIGLDQYAYDNAGNRIRVTDAMGAVTKYWYDTRGLLMRSRLPGLQTTTSFYDLRGNKTREVTANGDQPTWQYDYFGKLTGHTDMGGGVHSGFQYDKAGMLKQQTLTRGAASTTRAMTYYGNGALKTMTDSLAANEVYYAYDASGNMVRERYTKSTVVHQDNVMAYDELNRTTKIQDNRYTITYKYDANGNRRNTNTFYYDNANVGHTVDSWYLYDEMNRITLSQGVLNAGTIETTTDQGVELLYDAAGNRKFAKTKKLVSNQVTLVEESYIYDANNRLLTTSKSGNTTSARSYDAAGRVLEDTSYNTSGAITNRRVNAYNTNGKLTSQTTYNASNTQTQKTDLYVYDGMGNVISYRVAVTSGTAYTNYYTNSYQKFDSYKESQVSGTSTYFQPGTTTTTLDIYGNATAVSDQFAANRNRTFLNDAAGRILKKTENGAVQYYFYANGNPIGTSGPNGGVGAADFDYNYTPVSSQYPAAAPSQYVVNTGDTLQSIAMSLFGDAQLWFLIADANGIRDNADLKVGQQLVVPNKITNLHNDYKTFKVYNASEIIGDTTPTLPDPPPPPPSDEGCGGFLSIIIVAITVVVSIYAPMLVPAIQGMSAVGAAMASAALGNLAGQVVGMATGAQDGFNFTSLATSVLSAGIAQGANEALGITGKGFGNAVARSVVQNAVGQGVGIVLGTQDSFDWRSLAISAVSSAVSNGVGKVAGNGFGGQLVSGIAGGVTRAAMSGEKADLGRIVGDAFGNAIGNSVGTSLYDDAKTLEATERLDQLKGPDGKPIYQNEDQRAALINMLKQDPSLTPEKLARMQDMAKLSNAVYLKDPTDRSKGYRDTVPAHYERVTNYDELGLKKEDLENEKTGFYAGVFRDTRDNSLTLVFRGTDNKADWTYGNVQALSPNAPQYEQGIALAEKLKASQQGDKFTDIAGHSLGGGLAAASSMVTGIRATTFNAAGLSPETLTSRDKAWIPERAMSLITNYRVQDEVLTSLQERGSIGSLPLALLTPVIGPAAIGLNAFAAALPDAVGRQVTIGAFDQEGKSMSWAARNNPFKMQPVALHGMDYVMRGMLINDTKRP